MRYTAKDVWLFDIITNLIYHLFSFSTLQYTPQPYVEEHMPNVDKLYSQYILQEHRIKIIANM